MGVCTSSSHPPSAPSAASSPAACPVASKSHDKEQPFLNCSMTVGSLLDLAKTPGIEKKVSASNFDPASNCVGYACRKGRKPSGRQPNQDSWCVHRVPGKLSAYGVFDGHGEKGHLISDFTRQTLTKEVLRGLKKCEHETDRSISATLEEGYRQTQKSLMAKPHLGVQLSGTTATVVVHDHARERLTISHVGDSTAVLVKRKVGSAHELEGIALTRDHKPELEDEKRRIEQSGGRVSFDGYCHRVVKKHGAGPGLNMSRSLGDGVAHRVCGVSADPEVEECRLSPEDHALLVCSDGIWEVITPQEAADILKEYGQWQAMSAAKRLADEAARRWLQGTNGEMTDDITAIVAFLHSEQPPALNRADTCTTTAPSVSPSQVSAGTSRSGGSSNLALGGGMARGGTWASEDRLSDFDDLHSSEEEASSGRHLRAPPTTTCSSSGPSP